jgi:hypothetical protein
METPNVTLGLDTPTSVDRTAAPIRLQIAGADLLLSGRFDQWMPVALGESQEGPAVMQILFDVTSNGSARPASDLFSFKARSVEAVAQQSYRLKGTLQAGGSVGEVEALLQNPPGHTPFFMILFKLDRETFPELWAAVEERSEWAHTSGEKELRPRAWLREPKLAAA